MRIITRLKIVNSKPFFSVGPMELFEKIRTYSSIKKATEAMGMSYTKTLRIIRDVEKEMGFPMVMSKKGGFDLKKAYIVTAILLMLCLTAAACGDNDASETGEVELIVFAAASMTEALEEIEALYKETAPHVKLVFNFDSSGTLKTQIEQGADCHIFISAGQRQIDQLDISAPATVNTDGLDFVLQGTRRDILENRVTLCVPDGNPAGILSFNDLADNLTHGDILFAMGNSDVPVGQYTQLIFEYFNLDELALAQSGKITYGSNVKEVTTHISEGSVSAGIVYCTDAYSAGLEIVDYATVQMCGQVVYPACVLSASANHDEAIAFLDYLGTAEAMTVFERVGFAGVR